MISSAFLLPVILFFSLLSIPLFSSCDKDTNSYLDVLVINEGDRTPVPGVKVELYQNNCDPSDLNYSTGVTDGNGSYSAKFTAPAIINIKATLAVENEGVRIGTGSARLIEGETKTAQVILKTEIEY